MNKRICIMIGTKDRCGEVGMLLTSLLNQTYNDFDIVILDDGSRDPLIGFYFIQALVIRFKQRGNNITILRNQVPSGVSSMRQQLTDFWIKKTTCSFGCRIDDDSIVENDYLEQLLKVIDAGYDVASGIVPLLGTVDNYRDINFVKPIIGECQLNSNGELIYNGDDCGILYNSKEILPSHHFRSCALFKREIFENGIDYNSRLSKNGFREEQILSFKMLCKGYTIGCNTGAIAWHFNTPSGGERDTMNLGAFNQQIFEDTTKRLFEEHGDFIQKINDKMNIKPRTRTKGEYYKSTNLVSKKENYNLLLE